MKNSSVSNTYEALISKANQGKAKMELTITSNLLLEMKMKVSEVA